MRVFNRHTRKSARAPHAVSMLVDLFGVIILLKKVKKGHKSSDELIKTDHYKELYHIVYVRDKRCSEVLWFKIRRFLTYPLQHVQLVLLSGWESFFAEQKLT